ncbi:hypothetical protein [Lactobacillus sp. 3B(2020)]|uniref:hypothetical protein n=1 Tax=Lactobacillus sp. 3B(2020) TaxID=2695882 RepID=UPI0015DDD176|nr:hypothetical protein [Lactobacillus sp. 3B(2020)]QLL70600.1 hypothetical protein GTO83_08740 [Lactobacillus sp. 3B(2020)]
MLNRKVIAAIMALLGIILMASFSIQSEWFHSGILGILGSGCVISAYLILNWKQWQAKDHRVRSVTYTLLALCLILIFLRFGEALI